MFIFAVSNMDKRYSDCAELNCEPLNTLIMAGFELFTTIGVLGDTISCSIFAEAFGHCGWF